MNKLRFPQLLRWRILKPKRKVLTHSQSSQEQTIPGTCGDESTAKIAPASELSVITQLSELPLIAFIQCSCYGAYEVLALEQRQFTEAEKEELELAWHKLLYQYYDAKEDKQARHYLELTMIMEQVKFRAKWVDFMCTALAELYTEDLAAVLREEFPRLKFSKESYLHDIKGVFNMERPQKMKYDNAVKQLESLEQNRDKREFTPQHKEYNFYDSIIGINSVLKSSYEAKKLSALEYARLSRSAELTVEAQMKDKK